MSALILNWYAIQSTNNLLELSTMWGQPNLQLMKEILDNVDWEFILGPLDISNSWKCLKQFIRMLLIDVFLSTNLK